jgi:hypothetical protein
MNILIDLISSVKGVGCSDVVSATETLTRVDTVVNIAIHEAMARPRALWI